MEFHPGKQFEGVRIFSSGKADGSMNIRHGEGLENARRFLEKIKVDKPFCFGEQIHKNKITLLKEPQLCAATDGILTYKDYVLGIRTADCIPLMILNRQMSVIGAVHVSRKNLLDGIICKSLKRLLSSAAARPSQTAVFLGPHIRGRSYEIKDDILNPLKNSKWEKFVHSVGGKKYFDLTEALSHELEEIGILADNIIDCKIDTYTSDVFFSARRKKPDSPIRTFLTVIFKNG